MRGDEGREALTPTLNTILSAWTEGDTILRISMPNLHPVLTRHPRRLDQSCKMKVNQRDRETTRSNSAFIMMILYQRIKSIYTKPNEHPPPPKTPSPQAYPSPGLSPVPSTQTRKRVRTMPPPIRPARHIQPQRDTIATRVRHPAPKRVV